MDAQFIAERSYTIANYITKYETKGEFSTSDANFSDIQSNKSLASRLFSFVHRVLNH